MPLLRRLALLGSLGALLLACSDSGSDPAGQAGGSGNDPGTGGTSGSSGSAGSETGGGAGSSSGPKDAACASTFGQELGSVGYARFDGTVVAVVAPAHPTCPLPNSTHAVVQIRMHDAVYRMVVRMVSSQGTERRMFATTLDAPLPGDPWSDGWHTASLDYVTDLGLHADAFTPHNTADTTQALTDALTLGAPVSIFATAEDKPDSAHLVHREGDHHDGAIVVDPTGPSPHWLLYRFAEDSF